MITTPGLSGNGINSNTVTIVNKSLAYFGYELHPLPEHLAIEGEPIVDIGVEPAQGAVHATDHDEWNYYDFTRQGTYKRAGRTHGYLYQESLLNVTTDDRMWLYGTFTPEDATRLETELFDDGLGMVMAFYRGFEHKAVTLALSSIAGGKVYSTQDFLLVARPKSWL